MNELGLFDIYGPSHIPFWQTTWFLILFYTILAAIVGLTIWLLVRLFRARTPKLKSWQIALQQLESLKKMTVSPAQSKQFYFKLTAILKNYLQRRYSLDSLGKTDHELINYLKDQQFPVHLTDELQQIFMGSTIIKFANIQAMQDQIERDLQASILFVKKTIPTNT